ncbi:MAG: hypothetical protein M0R22_12340, partial [Dehalococcoidia bacterium]|nr:hypothetical protein [Dehalococcoidia bacterium]
FSIQSRGTNRLIQEGATLVRSVDDILEELGIETAARESCPNLPAQADAVQVRLLAAMGATPVHADDLARELTCRAVTCRRHWRCWSCRGWCRTLVACNMSFHPAGGL